MRMNKLALAIMLLAGATGALAAEQAGDPVAQAVKPGEPAAISSPDSGAQSRTESHSADLPVVSADPAAQSSSSSLAATPGVPAPVTAAPSSGHASDGSASVAATAPPSDSGRQPDAIPSDAATQPSMTTAPAAQNAETSLKAAGTHSAPQKAPASAVPQPQTESGASDSAAPVAVTPSAAEKPETPSLTPDAQQKTDADTPSASAPTPSVTAAAPFTPEQEARIGEVAKAYLLQHPELLIEVDQKLQKMQYDNQINAMTAAVIHHQSALLNDQNTPVVGPADARVAVIEFFDYQCSVCARQAPIMQSLMKSHPQTRFIFREWPIFGYRWKASFQAAETGLTIWQQKGADAYLKYHDALFATGHIEGALTQKDISRAASVAGAAKLKARSQAMLDTLSGTDELAKNLGFQGTPGIVVMPLSGATAENVTFFPGGATESMLQDALNKAQGQAR